MNLMNLILSVALLVAIAVPTLWAFSVVLKRPAHGPAEIMPRSKWRHHLVHLGRVLLCLRPLISWEPRPGQFSQFRRRMACNIGEGTHAEAISLLSDEAHGRHLLMTCVAASDTDHYAICAAGEDPIGVCPDEVASDEVGEARAIRLLSRGGTVKMVASEAITKGERVYTAAAGKVQDLPAGAGTYFLVGKALTAAAADGDVLEVESCFPVATVVS
jgi:hypothetical protein